MHHRANTVPGALFKREGVSVADPTEQRCAPRWLIVSVHCRSVQHLRVASPQVKDAGKGTRVSKDRTASPG